MQSNPPPPKIPWVSNKTPKIPRPRSSQKIPCRGPPRPEKKSKVSNNKNEIYTCISHNTKWK